MPHDQHPSATGVDGAACADAKPAMPSAVPTTIASVNVLLLPTRIASSKKDIRDLYHEYALCRKQNTRPRAAKVSVGCAAAEVRGEKYCPTR
jgi:hypothetical protein